MNDPEHRKWSHWFAARYRVGYLPSAAGGRIRYARPIDLEQAAKVLICVSGRTEFLEKYLETAYDLRNSGYSLVMYDHSGQGGSDRLLADREKGHIDDFSLYVRDLRSVIDTVAGAGNRRQLMLLGHSMGGTIASLVLAEDPHLADGLVLTAPMLHINTGPWLPPLLVEMVVRVVCRLGGGEGYAWGTGPFAADLSFRDNPLTGDARRYARMQRLMAADNRRLALGGPTFGWLRAAYEAMRRIRRAAADVTCPVLLLMGLADRVVGLPAVEAFNRDLPAGWLVRYAGGRHELLVEQDAVRNRVVEDVVLFLGSL
ncbi:alpha/beta fold hydrolase [Desulfofustis limnaeus]|uniref:Lysophospholipase L2 n=1 Tax=Desulfofustis limnaeus TaxID=2740163 RepID=A0ABN6M3P1_9BACT|nr:alpha/beta hydrolase [Desulfofustis limnaeus]MDX9893973.1 alpha/beta hydrolase [Desulfofustis sp.]BDD87506.1 lysophospholipase L2 [Desulfofustis limnaeus]